MGSAPKPPDRRGQLQARIALARGTVTMHAEARQRELEQIDKWEAELAALDEPLSEMPAPVDQ